MSCIERSQNFHNKKVMILVVDDENFNLTAIQLMLNRIYLNLDIITAKDG